MTQATYEKIMDDLARQPFRCEQGGMLLGPRDAQDLAIRYVKDEWGDGRPASFTIDADRLNSVIRTIKPAKLTCVGIIHSHPNGICRPSYGDLEFLRSIFSNPKNGGGYFLFPIVCMLADSVQKLCGLRGFIEVCGAGKFSHKRAVQQSTRYGIRWLQHAEKSDNGSKFPAEPHRSKKPNSNGSKSPSENRFKYPSSMKKTKGKNTLKQQTVVAVKHSETVQRLIDEGLDQQTAMTLEETKGADVINRQLDWLAARNPDKNRLGMLRKAIEEDWSKPTAVAKRERRESLRKREQLKNDSLEIEEKELRAKKKERNRKKQRLLEEWRSASRKEREQWMQTAVEKETSKMIAEMIRKQPSDTDKPHSHVLNVVARDRKLPCLF